MSDSVFGNVQPSFRDTFKAIKVAKRNDCHNDSARPRPVILEMGLILKEMEGR